MSKKADDMYWIATGLARNDARLLPIDAIETPREDAVLFTVKAPDGYHVFTLGRVLQWLQEYHDVLTVVGD